MRIEQYGSYATTSGVSSSTKKIGGVSLPDFNDFHFPTNTKPAMSDDKFREAITQQAKKIMQQGSIKTMLKFETCKNSMYLWFRLIGRE